MIIKQGNMTYIKRSDFLRFWVGDISNGHGVDGFLALHLSLRVALKHVVISGANHCKGQKIRAVLIHAMLNSFKQT